MASEEELLFHINVPPTEFIAWRSCKNVDLRDLLRCLGRVLYDKAATATYNSHLGALLIYIKVSESDFAKALDQCVQRKYGCQSIRPANRFVRTSNVIWDFIAFRLIFPK